MNKPILLYVSPFWPQKSGISEYSEALVEGLDKFFNIKIIINNYKIENKAIREKYEIIVYKKNMNLGDYDYIIYNIGNNPEYHGYMYDMIKEHPGYIILHDYVLYYLTVGYYNKKNKLFQKIYELEGNKGILAAKDSLRMNESRDLLHHNGMVTTLPLNNEIINHAHAIFVHSQYSEDIIKQNYKDVNTYKIHLVKCETKEDSNEKFLHKHFGIDSNAYIIGAVGFIAETKQNMLTCLAVKKYNETHDDKIHYVMIGEGNYVDHMLDDYIHKTGFLNNKEFFQSINSCDLILNLRYPYNGESSATLIQCMDMKKPCVVTDIGWFSEIPDDAVIKLPVDISMEVLCDKIESIKNDDIQKLVNTAKDYVESYCLADKIAKNIYECINNELN